MKKIRVALATEFLEQYGGAQKTLEAIAELYPDAPIFTAKYCKKKQSDLINSRKIIAPKGGLMSKSFFLFRMAPIFEGFDFSQYDLIISDGTTWNKGILTKPDQLHISYIHTPPRFLYGYSQEGVKWQKFPLIYSYITNLLRMWDFVAAQRPDFLVTNSQETRKRIRKFYRRDATVIYPPVDVDFVPTEPKKPINPTFIAVGRLARYKNFDLLIEAFNKLEMPLTIIGTGNDENRLKKLAKKNIKFLGHASEDTKHQYMKNCLGLINTVDDEDFGIVPIEVASHGKPVLAHGSGGHLESVVEGITGMYFYDRSVEGLMGAIQNFEKAIHENKFDSEIIKQHAGKFSKSRFQNEFRQFVQDRAAEKFGL
ncbi:MAG TPA: glycosyltransferase [Patescibacteria group bacterium]|nr:glycosyltransferase [Patescibacteria group bacterium]